MIPDAVRKLAARGALFVVNHSGGKDSQAMFAYLSARIPLDQIVCVYADLGEVVWPGTEDHIRANIDVPLHVVRSRRGLLQMISERGMFPSPSNRQCTSDLKRGPIEKKIRQLAAERKAAGHPAWGLIVNCMGMRAEESPGRSKLAPFKLNVGNSKAGREWYDWLPIQDWMVEEVFAQIAAANQKPFWIYAAGMSRMSCSFCIMSSKADLVKAAELRPEMYQTYVKLERSIGQVMLMPSKSKGRQSLEDVVGVRVA